ncbi:hypothetical protein ACQEU3_39975 [Spirillospora sp. CA-253888]
MMLFLATTILKICLRTTWLVRMFLRYLRSGRQRLVQTGALLRTSAELFALINLLAGDVGRYRLADAYGYAAWICADEADSDAARAPVSRPMRYKWGSVRATRRRCCGRRRPPMTHGQTVTRGSWGRGRRSVSVRRRHR